MVIAAIDTETYKFDENTRTWKPILSPDHFAIGMYLDENGNKFITQNKEHLWLHILAMIEKYNKKKSPLHLYAHNHMYDFLAYAPWQQTIPNCEMSSGNPFIVKLTNNGCQNMFLDTIQFYRGSLHDMAKELGLDTQKGTLPAEIEDLLFKDTILPYLENDVKVVLETMLHIREMCHNLNMAPQRLITIGQIAGNYLLNYLKKTENATDLLIHGVKTPLMGELVHPSRKANTYILNSLRLGRVEAYQTGMFENVTHLDMNSMFTWAATNMPIPNLNTEKLWKSPDSTIINEYGVSQCIITIPDRDVGILPVRLPENDEEYFPTGKGKTIIGTYTHHELQYAHNNGYKIEKILWSVTYKLSKYSNPFKEYADKIYAMRLKYPSGTFGNWFLKQILNHGWGKLAQHRDLQTVRYDDMNLEKKYAKEGYIVTDRNGHMQTYVKTEPFKMNSRYAPTLYTHITAYARIEHTKRLMQIPYEQLLYCDTDSIIYRNIPNISSSNEIFKYGNALGEWKLVGVHDKLLIYGKKAYGNNQFIKLSGVPSKDRNYNDFLAGQINTTQMHQLTPTKFSVAGQTYIKSINLHKMREDYLIEQSKLSEQRLFVDSRDLTVEPQLVNIAVKHGLRKPI